MGQLARRHRHAGLVRDVMDSKRFNRDIVAVSFGVVGFEIPLLFFFVIENTFRAHASLSMRGVGFMDDEAIQNKDWHAPY